MTILNELIAGNEKMRGMTTPALLKEALSFGGSLTPGQFERLIVEIGSSNDPQANIKNITKGIGEQPGHNITQNANQQAIIAMQVKASSAKTALNNAQSIDIITGGITNETTITATALKSDAEGTKDKSTIKAVNDEIKNSGIDPDKLPTLNAYAHTNVNISSKGSQFGTPTTDSKTISDKKLSENIDISSDKNKA